MSAPKHNTNAPTIKPRQEITIHRDGTVSYFSVYMRQWQRISAYAAINQHDDFFCALSVSDRRRINASFRSATA